MLTVLALILGEAVLLAGLYFAWWPLALIVAGFQLTAWALWSERPDKREVSTR